MPLDERTEELPPPSARRYPKARSVGRIYTGTEPHGLTYFPNPGRFSLGHDGIYR